MERDHGEFAKDRNGALSDADEDARLDALMASLPPAPGIKHVDDVDEEGDALAREQIANGEGIPHEIVGEWLRTWGRPGRVSFWDWYRARNG